MQIYVFCLFFASGSESCIFCPGVIYLKNMITQHWSCGDKSGTEKPVNNIPDEDRQFIRDNIVEAIIHSPERIR